MVKFFFLKEIHLANNKLQELNGCKVFSGQCYILKHKRSLFALYLIVHVGSSITTPIHDLFIEAIFIVI